METTGMETRDDPVIRLRGVRTNNLRSIDLDVPRGRLVVFAGVSGSGKSSLVFATIAAEAGHRLNETFPPFVRDRLPTWTRPDADRIEGLSPVVVVDQRRLGGNARSTVGTVTGIWTYLRLLFSRIGTPHVGEASRFSFNDPAGMCPTCSGLGEVVVSAIDRFLDLDLSLARGAIRVPGFGDGRHWYERYADVGSFTADTPLREWTEDERRALLYGGEHAARLGGRPAREYEGIVERFERIHLRAAGETSDRKRETTARFTRSGVCPECRGDRLNEAARTATVLGSTLGELARTEIADLAALVAEVDDPAVAPVVAELGERLRAMVEIGLGYLHPGRATTSLSGGESQRVKTVKHLGGDLVEMIYVFDEPTVGLHPSDVASMTGLLARLRDRGNTVLVVEHDPAVMAVADEIVEIGPGAGADGGRIVHRGSFEALRAAGTATAAALAARTPVRAEPRPSAGALTVRDATRNNLGNLTVDVPLGVLTVLTGVAGSGKSSLAAELIAGHGAVVIDQRPVTVNRRSTPVTYTGVAAPLRALFAAHSGLPAGRFSANSDGACPECRGLGTVRTDLAFLESRETVCPVCDGRRFTEEVLRHRVGGASIADIDDLTVTEAIGRLPDDRIRAALRRLDRVGLGHLRLGRPLTSLSGGECQRLKIARELREAPEPATYVLDEPTTGLHPGDVAVLLDVLDRLVEQGHTVVVIEHDVDVMRHADHIIDLGPGPGARGGRILYQGPPAGLRGTATADALHGG
ncbi:ATP-binding cassette domain-containing protein [Nocardiopsis sp. N85]|uniref:ATP-binding cassette domain-containing protein n=1 Tax=Nocardiopsis sp. N85 TaxID=3029400 RepID=UPI00237F5662|nr:ATP-binding cassette domain-containing protein [Nocardiopsis sp. N85]MDE3724915.1 ATP-binding cassette domain-containing protein [Nocardiopsis sp. N85]